MKKFTVFAVVVAGLALLVPGDGWSIGHVVVNAPPRPRPVAGPKVIPPPRPMVVNRTPLPGPTVIHPAPAVRLPTPAGPKLVPHVPIQSKFPATPGPVDVKTFVDRNKTKFVGIGQKGPTVPGVVRVEPPQFKSTKASVAVVQGYHGRLGSKNIIAGGKSISINNKRDDFVNNYQKRWSERIDVRHDRGLLVRNQLGASYHHLFTPDWWGRYRQVRVGWWGRWPAFAQRWYGFAAWEWWRRVTWDGFTAWCWGPATWAPPFYYDYGGNVVFENNVVYVEGQPVATEQDYANQAIQLAASGDAQLAAAPPSPEQIQAQWMPLGAFAVCNEDKGDPIMFLQLAVNKQGVIMGTYYNAATEEAQPITGAIDPKTQRAAWYLGDNKTTVMETGAYNLSAAETQVLVHFGPDQTQTWLLVRMQEPPKQ